MNHLFVDENLLEQKIVFYISGEKLSNQPKGIITYGDNNEILKNSFILNENSGRLISKETNLKGCTIYYYD